ncbi:MAG: DUF1788 domain-containing protein [Akkermansiaceae bacterium]|nr:DUF1788 domain-containing protein [Akkermansiaceae bacterium]
MNHLLDKLFTIFSSESFLSMQGLANEVPIFIQPYDVSEEDRVSAMIHALAQRLRTSGIKVAEVDLFHLLLEELRHEDLLDAFTDEDAGYDRQDLLRDIKNYADPKTRLVPRLLKSMEADGVQITLVSGVGHVYPFLRAHTLLDSIQPAMMHHPLVMFFPGEYIQTPGLGSQLRLFGCLPAKGYYRAFNLDHYRLAHA